MPVLETILSGVLPVLFERLLSRDLFTFSKSQGIDTLVKKLEGTLGEIKEGLAHAETEAFKNREVKRWLADLSAFAYDAEDLLEEIAIDASTSNHPKLKNQVRRAVDKGLSAIVPISGLVTLSVESKLDELSRRLECIRKRKSELGLSGGVSTISTATRETSSSFDKHSICGRDADEKAIVEMLFSDSRDNNVIRIIGMGGMGKTTLAQIVYDNVNVQKHFDLRVWVCAASHFDIVSLTRKIVQSFVSSSCAGMDLSWLHEKLKGLLLEKKFLIVLDDVWDGFYEDWYNFYHPFRTGVLGCKFIVTSRTSVGGAFRMCAGPVGRLHHIKKLSDDDCLSLLAYHALGSKNFDQHQDLHSLGKQIAKKCSGCPLIAMVLGSALCGTREPAEWETIRDAEVWDSLEENSNITAGLMLSYWRLPPHLKPCFAYCSLFPKGYLFDKDELVRLWMAEGFLPAEKRKQVRDVGIKCFDDLSSLSFFTKSSRDEKLFEMHDLISDLSRLAAADMFLHLDNKLESVSQYSFPAEVRHTSFLSDTTNVFDKIRPFSQMNCFRTLLALTSADTKRRGVSLSNDVLHRLLTEVSRLRVLSLNDYMIKELPARVRYLRHLRYLNLSSTSLECLPDSVTSLINLQALLLNNCLLLTKLPPNIGNLHNLRELDIAHTPRLQEIPSGVGKLTSLRKLCKFVVGKDKEGLGIEELANLSKLQGDLLISGLHNVVNIEDARKANLKDKHGLDDLSMVWGCTFDGSRDSKVEKEVMESLEPHSKLKSLKVKYYGGSKFASWIRDCSFPRMVSVELYDCRKVSSLPSLGDLPLLTDLSIKGLHGVTTVDSEFYGHGDGYPFPSLQTLRFEDMPEWVEWHPPVGGRGVARKGEVKRDFPRLLVLQMVNCPKLIGKLPEGMMNSKKNDVSPLQSLELKDCPSLVHSPGEKSMSTPELQNLIISGSSKLGCIAQRMHDLSISLETIHFSGFTNISRLPGSLHSLVNLKDLSIDNFGSLKCLPGHMHKLTSLQYLRIKNCQQLGSFPKGGFPPNLTRLSILECTDIRQPMSEWGLHKLTSLKKLELHDVCLDTFMFPEDDCNLPPNITHLSLSGFQHLVHLTEKIQELVSLESLSITNCLAFKTMEGLPLMLNHFDISGCPHMQKRFNRIDGDYRHHTANIHNFETD